MAEPSASQALWTLLKPRFGITDEEPNAFTINDIRFVVEVERAKAEAFEELLLKVLAVGRFPSKVLNRFYPPSDLDAPPDEDGALGAKVFFSILDGFLTASGSNTEFYQAAKDTLFELVQVKMPGKDRYHPLPQMRSELQHRLHSLEFTFLFIHVARVVYQPFFTEYGSDIGLLYSLGLLLFDPNSQDA